MPVSSIADRLVSRLGVERHERRPTLLLALFLLLGMATVICLKAVSDSVFLSEFDARRLPYVDLAVTLLVAVAVRYYLLLLRRKPLAALIRATQLFLVGNLTFFWFLIAFAPRLAGPLVYVWVGVFAVLIPSQVWSLAGVVFDARQAKRLFSLIGSGGILGAALGGSFTGLAGDPERVLPATVLFVAASAWIADRLGRHSAAARRPGAAAEGADKGEPLVETWRLTRASRYLTWIAVALFLSTVVSTLVKYEFKAIAQTAFAGDREALTSFNGYFYGWVAVFSFVFHVALSGRLLRWFGLTWCLFLMPLAVAGGLGMLLAANTLAAAIVARGADQGLRHSIDRASFELLFVPVPLDTRSRVKSFFDMFVGRAADALASLLLLAVLGSLGGDERRISLLALVAVGLWLVSLGRLRGAYMETLRETIGRRDVRTETLLENLAASGAGESLEASLRSSDYRDVESAVGWIRYVGGGAARSQLVSLLDHPSAEVRRKALAAIAAHDCPGCERAVLEFLVAERDFDQRVVALEYLIRRADPRIAAELRLLVGAEDRQLAALAAARLLAAGDAEAADAAKDALREFVEAAGKGGAAERAMAAKVLGQAPPSDEPWACLTCLLDDEDPAVVRAAIVSAARLRPRGEVARLIRMLGDRRYAPAARSALAAYGPEILDELSAPLRDPDAPALLQQQIARTLGRIGGPEAARRLLAYLRRPQQAARPEALRSLTRMRARGAPARFDASLVTLLAEAALRRYYELTAQSASLSGAPGPASEFLRRAVAERLDRALDEVFALLGLIFPPREIRDARARLAGGRPELRSNAVEFLDSRLIGSPLRAPLLPIVEGASRERLIETARQLFHLTPLPYPDVMRRLLGAQDPWLQSCACAAAAETGASEVRLRVAALVNHPDPILRESAAAALARLREDGPAPAWTT